MEKKHLKNIIFDLGGVLVGLDSRRCIEAFHSIGCGEVATYVEDHRVEDLFLEQELGNITTPQFCGEVRRICRCDATDEQIEWAWNQLLTPVSSEKLEMLKELKKHFRLFLLSNTNDIHWRKSAEDFFVCKDIRCKEYFDEVFLSYELHLAKPNKEIFETVLHIAGLNPRETLFIDDSIINCEAAADTGIGFLHERSGSDWVGILKDCK